MFPQTIKSSKWMHRIMTHTAKIYLAPSRCAITITPHSWKLPFKFCWFSLHLSYSRFPFFGAVLTRGRIECSWRRGRAKRGSRVSIPLWKRGLTDSDTMRQRTCFLFSGAPPSIQFCLMKFLDSSRSLADSLCAFVNFSSFVCFVLHFERLL